MNTLTALFQPLQLGQLSLPNRIVMAPMTRTFCPDHVPHQGVIDYYRRRAQNQVGLIITEGTPINHKAANGYPGVPFMYGEEALAKWQAVVAEVHAHGGKIAPQLWHVGAIRRPGVGPDISVPGYSPSGLYQKDKQNGVAMTQSDIDEVIVAFAQAAKDAQDIGFDAIEIHGAHGYLIDQFFWQETNQRTDKYAGSIAARSLFAAEIVKAVRHKVGTDFPIIFRFSQWKQQDYSARLAQNPDELIQVLQPLVDAGVDIFHCSTRRFWEPEFANSDLNLAGWTQELTGKPAITVGSIGLSNGFIDEEAQGMSMSAQASSSINRLEQLAQGVSNNEYQLVAVGRALLQDPEWVIKIREQRFDELQAFDKAALKKLI